MATTEQWIEWSRRYALPEWSRNHQLFIEVAMLATRAVRDRVPGMSVDTALACADHYWLSRYFGFLASGAVGRTVGTAGDLLSPLLGRMLLEVGSYAGGAVMAAANMVQAVAWDGLKLAFRQLGVSPPGGGPTASAPGPDDLLWATAGSGHALVFDAPYADQMIFGSALSEFNWHMRPLPPYPV